MAEKSDPVTQLMLGALIFVCSLTFCVLVNNVDCRFERCFVDVHELREIVLSLQETINSERVTHVAIVNELSSELLDHRQLLQSLVDWSVGCWLVFVPMEEDFLAEKTTTSRVLGGRITGPSTCRACRK